MCFGGGGNDTNNDASPGYAATPEAGAQAVQRDQTGTTKGGKGDPAIFDQTTMADVTSTPRTGATGLGTGGLKM